MNMKYLITLLLLAITACSSSDDYMPGQEGRVDGSVWEDGQFNSPEAKQQYCDQDPDAWFCSDIGTNEQAWVSHQYHGLLQGSPAGTCFGPNSNNNRNCRFPKLKQMRLLTSNNCTGHFSGQGQPSLLQIQLMYDSIVQGARDWDGKGAEVQVEMNGGATPSWYMPVTISCGTTTNPGSLAEGGLVGSPFVSHVSNMPTAPNGRDAKSAQVADAGIMTINAQVVWDQIKAVCGDNPSNAGIAAVSKWVGTHEMGHIFGFQHFNGVGVIMRAHIPNSCSPERLIAAQFASALGAYDSTPGSATIRAGSLGDMGPL